MLRWRLLSSFVILALLLTVFAVFATVLALVGMHGVIVYAVRQRQREIAVRMALGADRRSVRRLVLTDGGRLVVAGLIVGLLLTIATTRVLQGLLYGVQALDPWTLGLAVAVPMAVSAIALYLPARRASRFDPSTMLRAQ